MTIERKLLGTSPSGGAADVAEVFSTYVYTGTGSGQTIYNGIDLKTEGGLVWIKNRGSTSNHCLFDSARGSGGTSDKRLFANSTASETTGACDWAGVEQGYTGDPNGFVVNGNGTSDRVNQSGQTYASWTFRQKSGFFDCVTYTGDGNYNDGSLFSKSIPHSLGVAPALIMLKRTDSSSDWWVWHKYNSSKVLKLNSDATASQSASVSGANYLPIFASTASIVVTDTDFKLNAGDHTNGINNPAALLSNISGGTYVAYLFADNSAEDADDQMIKCGSYSGTGGSGVTVNLGWEAQWVMVKKSSATSDWKLMDNMRGMPTPSGGRSLKANDSAAEGGDSTIRSDSRGFTIYPGSTFDASGTYIYMAIRAPMMVEPKAATDVFAVDAAGSGVAPAYISGFPVDFAIYRDVVGSAGAAIGTRMLGSNELFANTNAAVAATGAVKFDFMDGHFNNTSRSANYYSWMWQRAKGYMDAVCYSGSSSAGNLTINHSLGVPPELIISKSRSSSQAWSTVFNINASTYQYFTTISTAADYASGASYGSAFLASKPTSTTYEIRTDTQIGGGNSYVAYLFATLAGISKVGSFVGNGSSQTISCGFSAGSRFLLIKSINATGDWYFWDSLRGIVAGNDPHTSLNTTAAQVTNDDSVDPANAGFIVNQNSATNINVSSEEYLFYAIA